MGNQREYLIKAIVDVCKRMDARGFGANHDGNVSVKYDGMLLATPTSESKGSIEEDMIITLDRSGKKVEGIGKPFSEIKLHLAAYRARAEAAAVVHAHPPFATARGLTNMPLEINIPEAVVSIGDSIPVTSFAMPGSEENDRFVAEVLREADVFMMPGNGILAIGSDVEQAYLRCELVEHIAKIDFYANQMGKQRVLSEQDVQTLLHKRASIGLGPKMSQPSRTSSSSYSADFIKDLIVREIKSVMKEQ